MNEQKCKRIERPAGFQIGRGNQPIHELIGLRGDYDFMSDILVNLLYLSSSSSLIDFDSVFMP
jgi:hypothetical protein